MNKHVHLYVLKAWNIMLWQNKFLNMFLRESAQITKNLIQIVSNI